MERDKNEIALCEAKQTALHAVFSVLPASWFVHVETHAEIHRERSSVGRARSRVARAAAVAHAAESAPDKPIH